VSSGADRVALHVSRELAARWDRLHRLRVAVLGLLFVMLTIAVT
jgi:hypothetical protein